MKVLMLIGLFLLVIRTVASESQTVGSPVGQSGAGVFEPEGYRVGPGDLLEVTILRLPELSREYHVAEDGTVEMPFLGTIEVQKKTAPELSRMIADRLQGDYLVDPQVSVVVKQINRRFFIQGAVRTPGVYTLERRPTLLQLITIAGGLNTSFGATAFIIHENRPAESDAAPEKGLESNSTSNGEPSSKYELKKANINALLRGEFNENPIIEPGDIVHIPAADVFFVAGEVKAPGSFALKEGTTLRQAISLAQGTNSVAATGRAVIFREDSNGQKREIPVDVGAVMRGRNQDVPILANDIVVVPNSKTKSAFVPVISAFGVNATWNAARIIR